LYQSFISSFLSFCVDFFSYTDDFHDQVQITIVAQTCYVGREKSLHISSKKTISEHTLTVYIVQLLKRE